MRLTQAAYEQQQQQHAYEQELHEEEQRQAHAARQVLACAHARCVHPRPHPPAGCDPTRTAAP
jgi:hypothetical protein